MLRGVLLLGLLIDRSAANTRPPLFLVLALGHAQAEVVNFLATLDAF